MARNDYRDLEGVFERWWNTINGIDEAGGRGARANRADAAKLRRVGTVPTPTGPVVDVALAIAIEAFRDLHSAVRGVERRGEAREETLVVAAATLAHLREKNGARRTADILSGEPGEDRPLMAEGRFLRLMRARTPADLLDEGRRLAALLPSSGAPVGEVGASLYLWLDDPELRRRWARTYYRLDGSSTSPRSPTEQKSETGAIPS